MNQTLGDRIKQLRVNRNLNQTDLAKLIGCTSSIISAYELNERKPSIKILIKISTYFNVSTDYLLGLNQNTRDPNIIDLSALTESQRTAIKQLIESIKKK